MDMTQTVDGDEENRIGAEKEEGGRHICGQSQKRE